MNINNSFFYNQTANAAPNDVVTNLYLNKSKCRFVTTQNKSVHSGYLKANTKNDSYFCPVHFQND